MDSLASYYKGRKTGQQQTIYHPEINWKKFYCIYRTNLSWFLSKIKENTRVLGAILYFIRNCRLFSLTLKSLNFFYIYLISDLGEDNFRKPPSPPYLPDGWPKKISRNRVNTIIMTFSKCFCSSTSEKEDNALNTLLCFRGFPCAILEVFRGVFRPVSNTCNESYSHEVFHRRCLAGF